VDFNARDQRRPRVWRRTGGQAGPAQPEREPDLEETQRLEGPHAGESEEAAARRALAETLPAQREGLGPQVDAAGLEGPAFAGSDADGPGFLEPGVVPGTGGRLSRRVLFAAGGLALVGGCGVAAASRLSSSGSSSSAASPVGTGSPFASPAAAVSTHSPSSAPSTPADLSSSTGTASPPPDVANPGSGIDPSKVQSAPEYYVHAGPKVIALTLDDGPHPLYTPQILALLQQYKITATFCMIGQQIGTNKSLVAEVVAAGHMVVNHTWNHADQSKLTLSQIRSQISRTNDALAAVGTHPSVFRAPYGAWSHLVFEACADADLRPLDWSVDPRDWSRPGTSTIVSRILSATRTGSIILEHDGGGDRSQTVAALKIVLPKLLDEGYRFTTV
jgi:peptidoglycan/xylan/chitin deacetylase (PgdA/CDA1 family)